MPAPYALVTAKTEGLQPADTTESDGVEREGEGVTERPLVGDGETETDAERDGGNGDCNGDGDGERDDDGVDDVDGDGDDAQAL